MAAPVAATATVQEPSERAVDVSRLVDELTDMWSPLVRHHRATLVCEVSTRLSRHILLDVGQFHHRVATCVLGVLEDVPAGSIVHLRLLPDDGDDGRLCGLRCLLGVISTTDESGAASCIAEFAVPASPRSRGGAPEAAPLDGARLLVLTASNLAGAPMASLCRMGAEVHATSAPCAVVDILLSAARAGDPFDLCILDVGTRSVVDAVISELRRLPAFTSLPVVLVTHERRDGGVVAGDGGTATCDTDKDDLLDCVARVLAPPEATADTDPGVWHTWTASRPGGHGIAGSQRR